MLPMITSDTQWDESAKRVLNLCREIAVDIGGNFIGTESLLLALVSETNVAEHGVDLLHYEAVLCAVRDHYTPSEALTDSCQTPRYKMALEAAAKRAASESREISRRDLWHGVLADKQSLAVTVLASLRIEDQARKLLG
jgi:ATP-dependent Clp protease ATP-binding subunit ClpA